MKFFFVAPVFFILLWLYMRLSTPPRGFVSEKISFREKTAEFYILLGCVVLIFGGMVLIPFFTHNIFVISALIAIALILYAMAMVWSSKVGRRKRQHDIEVAEEAVKVGTIGAESGMRNGYNWSAGILSIIPILIRPLRNGDWIHG